MAEVMDLAPDGGNNNNDSLEKSVPHDVFCVRFSTEFEEWLAGVDGKSHEMLTVFGRIKDFCKEVSSSKNYLLERMHNDQWLQSEITLKSYSIHVAIASKPQGEVLEQLPVDGDSKDVMVSPNSSSTADVDMTVRSNILPRQASLKKLGSVATSHASKYLSLSWLLADAGVVTPGGLGGLFYKVLKDWKNRGICELLKQLSRPCLQDVSNVELPTIPSLDVKLGDQIANGSTADVWRVTISQGIFVKKEFKSLDIAGSNIGKETQIVQRLSHPHIVHTFGCIGSNNPASEEFSLLMESMQHDLSSRITIKPHLEPLDLLDVLLQVAEAMEYLRRVNVVHGDLKTQNILFSQYDISGDNGSFIVVKVADFGSAQTLTISNRESFKPSHGTTKYAAPEVLWNSRPTKNSPMKKKDTYLEDPFKIDVYSFGITAYEVLTGYVPFDQQKLTTENLIKKIKNHDLALAKDFFKTFKDRTKKYPELFISFMQSCWAYDPKERPSFQEIIKKIEEAKVNLITREPPFHCEPEEEQAKHPSLEIKSSKHGNLYNLCLQSRKILKRGKEGVKGRVKKAIKIVEGVKGRAKKVIKNAKEGAKEGAKEACRKRIASKRRNNQVCPQPTHSNSTTGAPVENRLSEDKVLKRTRKSEPYKSKKKSKS